MPIRLKCLNSVGDVLSYDVIKNITNRLPDRLNGLSDKTIDLVIDFKQFQPILHSRNFTTMMIYTYGHAFRIEFDGLDLSSDSDFITTRYLYMIEILIKSITDGSYNFIEHSINKEPLPLLEVHGHEPSLVKYIVSDVWVFPLKKHPRLRSKH